MRRLPATRGGTTVDGTMGTGRHGRVLQVGEAGFGRAVRTAAPAVVLFGAAGCPASRALAPILDRLAGDYAGRLSILRVSADRAPLLTDSYGVTATPTLLVFAHGEELTRVVGFAPDALLRLLCEEIVAGSLAPGRLWSPTEGSFEDAVILPLIADWGWAARRQVSCPARSGRRAAHDRVDILVSDEAGPITLFESKRQIASAAALQAAASQGYGYAAALRLPAFVVAAPVGMWLYAVREGRPALVEQLSSLEVATRPQALRQGLRRLSGRA